MLAKFDNIKAVIKNNQAQVTEALNAAKNYLSSELEQLYVKLNKVESKLFVLEDRIDSLERDKVNNDIVIRGVPHIKSVNLYDVVMNICKAIDIQDGPAIVLDMFRSINTPGNTLPPPIIIKFVNWQAKMRFFRNYIKLGNLNLTHIGLQSTSRIYCNDGLTRTNSLIFSYARSLQKKSILSKVTTKKGQIYVSLPNQSIFILIKSINELNELSVAHQSQTLSHENQPLNNSNKSASNENHVMQTSSSLSSVNNTVDNEIEYGNSASSSTQLNNRGSVPLSTPTQAINTYIDSCFDETVQTITTGARNLRSNSKLV